MAVCGLLLCGAGLGWTPGYSSLSRPGLGDTTEGRDGSLGSNAAGTMAGHPGRSSCRCTPEERQRRSGSHTGSRPMARRRAMVKDDDGTLCATACVQQTAHGSEGRRESWGDSQLDKLERRTRLHGACRRGVVWCQPTGREGHWAPVRLQQAGVSAATTRRDRARKTRTGMTR